MAESFLLYAPSGHYKTAQLGLAALWLWRKTGLTTRLISGDGGGWRPLQPLVDAGIVDAWQVSTLVTPLPVIRKLARGMWPRVENGKLVLRQTTPEEFSKIGAYAVEGLSSVGDLIIRDLVQSGRKISEDVVGLFQQPTGMAPEGEVEEQEKFGAPGRSHYGFVQNELPLLLGLFRSLPIRYLWITSLEARGEDDSTGMKESVLGPAIAGKKAVSKVSAWVGEMLHGDVTPDKNGQPAVRYYFRPAWATEMPGKVWPAKTRLAPQLVAKLLERYPDGCFTPTLEHGFDEFLEFEESIEGGMSDALAAEVAARSTVP